MTDLTVIILVGREELHIKRCLEKLAPLEARQIVVVESQKGDATHALAEATARKLGWQVEGEGGEVEGCRLEVEGGKTRIELVWHDWEGNQARQFNWALDHVVGRRLKVEGCTEDVDLPSWILRLDADEYLTDDSIEWLKEKLKVERLKVEGKGREVEGCGLKGEGRGREVEGCRLKGEGRGREVEGCRLKVEGRGREVEGCRLKVEGKIGDEVGAMEFTLERKFCGGMIRHGTNGIKMVRMFRRGMGRYGEGEMDERIVCKGALMSTPVVFLDDSLIPLEEWKAKHRGYAKREAAQALEGVRTGKWTDPRKAKYYRLPPYLRAFLYFGVRYFLKGGFLDGRAGWKWNFWQGLWYRLLVDRTIGRLKVERLKG